MQSWQIFPKHAECLELNNYEDMLIFSAQQGFSYLGIQHIFFKKNESL